MAKRKAFGKGAENIRSGNRKMAKVIISKKHGRGKFSYKEAIIDQDDVKDYVAKHKD